MYRKSFFIENIILKTTFWFLLSFKWISLNVFWLFHGYHCFNLSWLCHIWNHSLQLDIFHRPFDEFHSKLSDFDERWNSLLASILLDHWPSLTLDIIKPFRKESCSTHDISWFSLRLVVWWSVAELYHYLVNLIFHITYVDDFWEISSWEA